MHTRLSVLALLICLPLASGCTTSPQGAAKAPVGSGKADTVKGCCTSSDCDGPDGDGDEDDGACPLAVSGSTIAAGGAFSLIRGADGRVFAFGHNGVGELGDGSNIERDVPVQSLAAPAAAIAAGGNSALALSATGTVQTWGNNMYGQLGLGWTGGSDTDPLTVSGRFVSASVGGTFMLALSADGTVSAWGDNALNQLGGGPTSGRNLPGLVPGLTNVTAIAAGLDHALALLRDGTVVQFGYWYGQGTEALPPTPVSGLSGVVSVAAGENHCLALLGDGTVMAWGYNMYGQLGDGTNTSRLSPVPVRLPAGAFAVRIAAGENHSLAVLADGSVVGWGMNLAGQLGLGNTVNQSAPQPVVGLGNVTEIAAGDYHSIARRSDGTVLVWGSNFDGALGIGHDSTVPAELGRF